MRRLLVLAMGLLAPALATAGGYHRLAVMPFDNVARAPAGRETVMPAVIEALARRGYEVVEGPTVERALDARRIRYVDSFSAAQATDLLAALGADALVTGGILAWDTSQPNDPAVAVVMRIVGPGGSLLWSGAASTSSSATERTFGTGRVKEIGDLARRAVADMLAGLPAGDRLEIRPDPGVNTRRVRVFRSTAPVGAPLAISVLPFDNFTTNRDVTRIFEKIVLHQLSRRPGITCAEPAEVRRTFPSGKGHLPSRVAAVELAEASRSIGSRFVLSGAVFHFSGDYTDQYGRTPLVEIHLRLTDVETGAIRWSGSLRRVGRAYEGVFQRGAITDAVTLAHVVVDELLSSFLHP